MNLIVLQMNTIATLREEKGRKEPRKEGSLDTYEQIFDYTPWVLDRVGARKELQVNPELILEICLL